RRVQPLWAGPGAVHDRVTAIEAERVIEPIQALAGALIAAVGKPAVGLEQDRRAEILVLVPPVARARSRAAEAQNAFPLPIELGPIFRRLPAFAVRRRLVGLQPRLDQFVLGVEPAQIRDEVLQDRHVWQRCDAARSLFETVHGRETGKPVRSIDIHGAGAAYPLATGSPERQGRIDFVINLDQRIENHWPASVTVDFERIERRVLTLRRVPSIDPKAL